MDMTTPIIIRVFLDEDYNPTSTTMHLYLPSDHQAAPPAPTAANPPPCSRRYTPRAGPTTVSSAPSSTPPP